MEFAAHDGRVLHGQGLSYAVANRGADHMHGGMLGLEYNGDIDPKGTLGKAETPVEEENYRGFRDTGIVCAFAGDYLTDERLAQLFDATYDELLAVGAKTVELERHFNNQRGIDVSDDRLPYEIPDVEEAVQEYYAVRGWNEDGTVPSNRFEDAGVGTANLADD